MFSCSVSSIEQMVQTDVLPMRTWADNVHMRALVTALPVRLKLLDVAGSDAYVQTFEPGAATAAANPQQVWLIFEPMHYEVLYPAEAYKNVDKLS